MKESGEKGVEEVWRPTENVDHELGGASLLYEDRIVIFKEKGRAFPHRLRQHRRYRVEEDGIEAKTADLRKELIGFNLIAITPVA